MVRHENERTFEEIYIQNGPGKVKTRRILEGPAELCSKGRIYNHTYIPKGSGIGWHIHQGTCECYYVLKGEGRYSDNGRETILHPGDVTFTADGEGHSLVNEKDEVLEVIALVLNS